MGRKAKDYTGMRFGKLVVLRRVVGMNKHHVQVECKCDCGKIFTTSSNHIGSGHTKSCGCLKHETIDYTGRRFGKLVVLRKMGTKRSSQLLECKCDCGKISTASSNHIVSGKTKSCGCLKKIDYTGMRFGKLVVLRKMGMKRCSQLLECKCDCGKIFTASSSHIVIGDTKSCGCLVSYKNWQIDNWLRDEGYDYQAEYTFPECKNIKSLPFDFAVFNGDEIKLIEYHGKHHYEQIKGRQQLGYTQNMDTIKMAFCENFDIPLLVLDHTYPDIFFTIEWFLDDPIGGTAQPDKE